MVCQLILLDFGIDDMMCLSNRNRVPISEQNYNKIFFRKTESIKSEPGSDWMNIYSDQGKTE